MREHGWIRQWLAGFKSRDGAGRGIVKGRVSFLADDHIRITMGGREAESSEEFALKVPTRGVSVGDEVRVSYHKDGDRKCALRIEELSSRQ